MQPQAGLGGPSEGFVGRRSEQARLLRRWEEVVQSDDIRVVLLGGEPGIGKSALIKRVCASIGEATPGVTVLQGRADEDTAPYQAWIAALRPLGFTARFRQIVAGVADPATGRTLVFEAIVEAVAAAAPAVVVLDDVQWSDESTIAVARHLAKGSLQAPVLLVLAYRDIELRPTVARLLGDLSNVDRAERMALVGLNADEVGELTGRDDGWRTHEWTGGNPFLVRAVAQHDRDGPPPAVEDLVAGWLGPLSEAAKEAVRVAAICGRKAEVHLVEAIVGEGARSGLAEAATAGLLVSDGGTAYGFAHEILRDCVLSGLPTARTVDLHRQVAQALSTRGAPATEVDRHRREAGGEDAFAAAVSSADRARAAHAYESAAEHRRSALAVVSDDASARFEVAMDLAEDLALTGSVVGEREALMMAIECGRALDDPERTAAALARLPLVVASETPSADLIVETLERLRPGDSALRARLLIRQFYEATNTNYPETVRAIHDDAVAIASRVDDGATLARAVIARAIYFPDTLTAADLDLMARHEAEMGAVFGTRTLRRSRAIRITWRAASGDFDAARREVSSLERGPLSGAARWTVLEWRALEAFLAGRLDDALRTSDDALRQAEELGEDLGSQNHRLLAVHVDIERGARLDAASMDGMIQGVLQEHHRLFQAKAAVLEGDRAAAREIVDGIDVEDFASKVSWTLLLFTLADTVVELGDPAIAHELLTHLRPRAGTVLMPPLFPSVCLGATDRILGLLAETAGRMEEARHLLTEALALDTRIGADLWAAHDRFHLGRLLESDQPERAASLLDVAASEAQRMGLRRLEGKVARIRDSALFRRDGSGWVISYEGKVVRLPDRRGFEWLRLLLARPGREVSTLDLVGGGSRDRPPALDDRAKEQYRRRLAELDSVVDEAERHNDARRGEGARLERDALVDELARAVGLGGRDRPAGADTERARVNVTRAVRRALAELEGAHPALARHLSATIHTGLSCSYTPDPRNTPRWRID
ncbi:MAG TPA: AAA family ATPase [Acidimicrobiales bacterium]|nr:AAA family ATPase [Acidimicrobiales bacterium]